MHISELGFQPGTVIDVGVAWGTPVLYSAFPNAYFVLVEALPVFEPHLQDILKGVQGEYHLIAVSDEPGRAMINVRRDALGLAGASLEHVADPAASAPDYAAFAVEIGTLDAILSDRPIDGPCLLKTDVQGFDMRVLKGASKILQRVDVVVSEVGVRSAENDVQHMTSFMREAGFVLYDISAGLNRPRDNALAQMDLVFAREGSHLVAFDGWA